MWNFNFKSAKFNQTNCSKQLRIVSWDLINYQSIWYTELFDGVDCYQLTTPEAKFTDERDSGSMATRWFSQTSSSLPLKSLVRLESA